LEFFYINKMETYLVLFILSLLLGLIFKFNTKRKKQNRIILTYQDLLDSDENIILYLRSFKDDSNGQKHNDPRMVMLETTYEQNLASSLKNEYFVTVGKPEEELPQLGAYRFYVGDNNWKEQVGNLIKKSKYIIIKPSNSDGLKWELDYIFKNNYKEKLIFFHQYGNYSDTNVLKYYYSELKKYLSNQYNIEMSDYKKDFKFSHFTNDNHILVKSIKNIL
jgi:hypothetical protein